MTETAREPLGVYGAGQESVLARIDPGIVSSRARAESRNREVHLPPIGAFRWWARRTQAVNGAVLDSFKEIFGDRKLIVDPFAGGGTIGLAAILRGHRTYVQDINPWAAYGLKTMLGLPPTQAIRDAGTLLANEARPLLDRAYSTKCSDSSPGEIAHTLRVAVGVCSACGTSSRLFPYSVLTLLTRKERGRPEAYLACPRGHVFLGRADRITPCTDCGLDTNPRETYTACRIFTCTTCGHAERLQVKAQTAGLSWEVVLVERVRLNGVREFGLPSTAELKQASDEAWHEPRNLGTIPEGRETSVLLRHGFYRWNDLYPLRQQVVTQTLLDLVETLTIENRVADVLRLAIVGSTEFAGHLSRWDRWYLKCNDATAGHRFNFSTFVPEPNVWGAGTVGRGTVQRRLRSFAKASDWFHERTHRETQVEYLDAIAEPPDIPCDVTVAHGSSEHILLRDSIVDLVLTDPPYHDDVQYGELSLLFRTWANLPLETLDREAAVNHSTGLNTTPHEYQELLERIFRECRRVLKSDGRLIFSYANRDPWAWISLFTALQNAGFYAVAYLIVHSENETDYAKRDVRACTKDFVMELLPDAEPEVPHWVPPSNAADAEDDYLRRVGAGFLQIGQARPNWNDDFVADLRRSPFLTPVRGRIKRDT